LKKGYNYYVIFVLIISISLIIAIISISRDLGKNYYKSSIEHMMRYCIVSQNLSYPDVPDRINILELEIPPISKEDVYRIARDIFGFNLNRSQIKYSPTGRTEIIEGEKYLLIIGKYMLLYDEEIPKRYMGIPSENETIRIALDFLNKLYQYFPPPPNMEIKVSNVRPGYVYYSTVGNETSETILSVRVEFKLMYNGVEIVGPSGDYTVSIAGNKIINVEIHHLWVREVGEVDVNVSPSEAIEKFLNGEIEKHGELILPPLNSCSIQINDIKLVYYADLPEENMRVEPYYIIHYTLKTVCDHEELTEQLKGFVKAHY